MFEMCCTQLAGNTGCKKSPSGHHRTTLFGYIFATKACIDNRKKNLLSSNISSRCPHNMVNLGPQTATSVREFETPSKFQPLSHLCFVTAATSLTGGQPNFAGCLAVSWAGTHTFLGLLTLKEFCQLQNSLCIQVLRFSILAV